MGKARNLSKSLDVNVGEIAYFSRETAPEGWLRANGALVSRTTYAALFAAIGTTYGAGNGSTTFALPDLRGEFLRGWDDGRGVDSGRGVGTSQGENVRMYSYARTSANTPDGFSGGPNAGQSYSRSHSGSQIVFDNHTATWRTAAADETRPRNIALLACIKF